MCLAIREMHVNVDFSPLPWNGLCLGRDIVYVTKAMVLEHALI
jgi:hypothetical protein